MNCLSTITVTVGFRKSPKTDQCSRLLLKQKRNGTVADRVVTLRHQNEIRSQSTLEYFPRHISLVCPGSKVKEIQSEIVIFIEIKLTSVEIFGGNELETV